MQSYLSSLGQVFSMFYNVFNIIFNTLIQNYFFLTLISISIFGFVLFLILDLIFFDGGN